MSKFFAVTLVLHRKDLNALRHMSDLLLCLIRSYCRWSVVCWTNATGDASDVVLLYLFGETLEELRPHDPSSCCDLIIIAFLCCGQTPVHLQGRQFKSTWVSWKVYLRRKCIFLKKLSQKVWLQTIKAVVTQERALWPFDPKNGMIVVQVYAYIYIYEWMKYVYLFSFLASKTQSRNVQLPASSRVSPPIGFRRSQPTVLGDVQKILRCSSYPGPIAVHVSDFDVLFFQSFHSKAKASRSMGTFQEDRRWSQLCSPFANLQEMTLSSHWWLAIYSNWFWLLAGFVLSKWVVYPVQIPKSLVWVDSERGIRVDDPEVGAQRERSGGIPSVRCTGGILVSWNLMKFVLSYGIDGTFLLGEVTIDEPIIPITCVFFHCKIHCVAQSEGPHDIAPWPC